MFNERRRAAPERRAEVRPTSVGRRVTDLLDVTDLVELWDLLDPLDLAEQPGGDQVEAIR